MDGVNHRLEVLDYLGFDQPGPLVFIVASNCLWNSSAVLARMASTPCTFVNELHSGGAGIGETSVEPCIGEGFD
jgi:hypothetical protein